MEVYEMSDMEKENRIEDLDLVIENLLHAKECLAKAMNDIEDIEEADDLRGYFESDLNEVNRLLDMFNDELKEILEEVDMWENDYVERMNEYRKMQGF